MVDIIPFEPSLNKTAIYKWASAMQIAQTADDALTVRYVGDGPATEAMRKELTAFIHQSWHPDLEVVFLQVDDLPRNVGGKQ